MARTPPLVTLLGSKAYSGFLDRLIREARTRNLAIETRAGLVEHALNKLGLEWGIAAPQRARPIGANQHPLDHPSETSEPKPTTKEA